MEGIHIPSLQPEVLFKLGPLVITNTVINTWVGIIILFVIGIIIYRRISLKPGPVQNFAEFILEKLLPFCDQVTGSRKKTLKFLPITGSIFFFILLSNWLGIIPGTGSILIGGDPLLRPASSDLNLNIAMALVSVLASHIYGFLAVGVFTHLGKFVQIGNLVSSITKGPIEMVKALVNFFVGLVEIISEVAKIVSLSLRLFGNILAGEVLLTVISALITALAPTPFMLLELIMGFVQATIFAMLTLSYMVVAVEEPHFQHE